MNPRSVAAIALGLGLALAAGGLSAEDAGVLPTGPSDIPVERTLDLPAGELEGGVRAVAFSRDGLLLAAAGFGGGVYVRAWPADGAGSGWSLVHEHEGSCAAVGFVEAALGASLVASVGDDGVIALSPARAGEKARSVTISAGIGPITALAVLDGGAAGANARAEKAARIVAGAASGAIAIVRLSEAPAVERVVPGAHEDSVTALAGLRGGRFASAGLDGRVRIGDLATGKEIREARVGQHVAAIASSPDGTRLAIAGAAPSVLLLDARTLREVGEPVAAHANGAQAVLLGERRLVSASIADEQVAVSGASGPRAPFRPLRRTRLAAVPSCLALAPGGTKLACGLHLGGIAILDLGPENGDAARGK